MLVLPAGLERVTVAPLEARVLVTVLVVVTVCFAIWCYLLRVSLDVAGIFASLVYIVA